MELLLTSLIVFALTGCALAIWTVRKTRRVLTFQFLVLVNYVAINLFSGVFHFLDLGVRRGYFDAVGSLKPSQLGQLVAIQGIGLLGLCIGLQVLSPAAEMPTGSSHPRLFRFDQFLLLSATVIILPISLISLVRIRAYASSLEVFGGRIISVDGGMARYAFLSQWLVWAISFAVIWLAYSPLRKSGRSLFVAAVVGLLLIIASMSWTGGRSIVLVFTLPLILVLLPFLPRSKFTTLISGISGIMVLLLYASRISASRTATSRQGTGNFADWLDWEWGRFSMLGLGVNYVNEKGNLFGETFLTSIGQVLSFLATDPLDSRSSTTIAGTEIFNSNSVRYLAPGLSFELYINFGVLGVFLGYALVGWACRRIDHQFIATPSVIARLMWAYVGTVLVFRVLPADPSALVQALIYAGTPLIAAASLSYLNRRRRIPTFPSLEKQSKSGVQPSQ